MKRFGWTYAILAFALLPLKAQSVSGRSILQRCADAVEGVRDYTVDLEADINMERLRMPKMKAVMYFKAPDKIHFESPNFALLPREGFGLPVSTLLERYEATIRGEEKIEEAEAWKLHLVAKDPAARIQQLYVWVNKGTFALQKIETVPYQGRSVKIQFLNTLHEGVFWLPEKMTVELTIPQRDSVAMGQVSPVPGGEQLVQNRRPMRSGTITVVYSNYRINTGLSDDVFKAREMNEQ